MNAISTSDSVLESAFTAPGSAAREVSKRVLLVQAGGRICALPVSSVVETMRALPMQGIAGVPEAVRGLSIIRGVPVPIVDLAALLGENGETPAARLVTIRVGERQVGLAVQAVLGIRETSGLADLPPLLEGACAARVEAIAALDSQFLWVLDAARLIPEGIWDSLSGAEM
jgi:purine-binding chemotaxis protein CheW